MNGLHLLIVIASVVGLLATVRYLDFELLRRRRLEIELDELEVRYEELLEDNELYSRWVSVLLSENARLRERVSGRSA